MYSSKCQKQPALSITLLAVVLSRMSDIEAPLRDALMRSFSVKQQEHTSASRPAMLDVTCRGCITR
jgi:hypothetical protein